MRQKKIIKWFGIFFAVMLLFTALSQAAASVNVPQVSVKTIQNQLVTHTVTGEGKVEGTAERAVFAQENLKVGQVLVQEGQAVKSGDVLLTLTTESLQAAIKEKEDTVEELTLKIRDLKSSAAVEQQKRETEKSYAGSNYSQAAASANVDVDNAQEELNVAKKRLEEYYEDQAADSFSDGSVGAGVTASDQGGSVGADLPDNDQSGSVGVDLPDSDQRGSVEADLSASDQSGSVESDLSASDQSGSVGADLPDSDQSESVEADLPASDQNGSAGIGSADGGMVGEASSAFTDSSDEKNLDGEIAEADTIINVTEEESGEIDSTASNESDSSEAASETDDSSGEQALLDDVRQKHESLNSAITARNQAILSAEQQLSEANLPEATDGTLENTERELENAQEELDTLNTLMSAGGQITAPADGVVKKLNTATGSVTGAEAAVVLYETGGSLRMTGTISKDDEKYVETGGEVSIKDSSGNTFQETVESVKADETDESLRTVSILIPADSLSIGQSASFTITKSAGPFNSCVPLSAIHQENNTSYVYVIDTTDSVLGEVLTARKVEVKVQDKNETLAALSDGTLTSQQQIIVDSDRELTDGGRVRMAEAS